MACMDFILRVVWTSYLTSCAAAPAIQSDGSELAYWVMTQAFWLATLKTDGPITGNITILLGHAIFASSEYCYDGYRRIARSISSKSIYALNLACKLLLWLFSYLLCRATLHLSLVVWQDVLHLFLVKTWQVLYLIVFLHIHNHKSVTIMKNPRNIT